MPNGKTHFIAGAVVGAAVNFIIQSAKMAMDYDRPFDWNQFFLCAGAGAFTANPDGITTSSPGLRRRSYPGWEVIRFQTLKGFRPGGEFFHGVVSAGLIAYAISTDRLKFSRTTRLFLWAFGISHLTYITRNSISASSICQNLRTSRKDLPLKSEISNLRKLTRHLQRRKARRIHQRTRYFSPQSPSQKRLSARSSAG
jgi:hypothetical protein